MSDNAEPYITAGAFPRVRKIFGAMLDMLVPNVCVSCQSSPAVNSVMCDDCRIKLLNCATLPYCRFCGMTLGPHLVSDGKSGCYDCPVPMPRFRRVYRLGPYAGVLKPVVRKIKYHSQWAFVKPLAELLAEHIRNASDTQFDIAMPVPMFWTRRMLRNGNHSWVIAQCLADRLGLPVSREIIRVRNTPQQAHFSRTMRMKNVKGAFCVRNENLMNGVKVLLVDDVVTTGATADEAARVLLDAGASEVHLAVFAKAGTPIPYEDRNPAIKV